MGENGGKTNMAYRKKKRFAGRAAHKVARKVYRKALRLPKKRLAKLYAAKCGKSRFKRLTRRRR